MPRLHRTRVCEMTRQQHSEQYFDYRVRYLPGQIEAAERKLTMLRNEASRYGLRELAEPRHV